MIKLIMITLSSLCLEESLTQAEILSMNELIKLGYRYNLYTYSPVENVPVGICVRNGNEVYPEDKLVRDSDGTYSSFITLFKYILLFRNYDNVWVDTDVVIKKQISFQKYSFVTKSDGKLSPCIIKIPKNDIIAIDARDKCLKEIENGNIKPDIDYRVLYYLVNKYGLHNFVQDLNKLSV